MRPSTVDSAISLYASSGSYVSSSLQTHLEEREVVVEEGELEATEVDGVFRQRVHVRVVGIQRERVDEGNSHAEIGVEKAHGDVAAMQHHTQFYSRFTLPSSTRTDETTFNEYAQLKGESCRFVSRKSTVVTSVNTVIPERTRDSRNAICL